MTTNIDRALLLSEWSAGGPPCCCPCCTGWWTQVVEKRKHDVDCPIDLALSERGYCTQQERDHARALIQRGVATAATVPPPEEKP